MSSTTTTTLAYLHGDQLGSVSLTTDANGAVTSQQNYDVWGKARGTTGGTSPTTLNYTGQKRDETGLLFYNARYYDPAIGRFLSADTIAIGKDSQSRNRYTYVGNNPINATDPTGHCVGDKSAADQPCQNAANAAEGVNRASLPGLHDDPTWTIDKINDLLRWLKRGVRFRGSCESYYPDYPGGARCNGRGGWTSDTINAVREALDRIYTATYAEFNNHPDPVEGARLTMHFMDRALGLGEDGEDHAHLVFTRDDEPGPYAGLTIGPRDTLRNKTVEGIPVINLWMPRSLADSRSKEYWIESILHELGHVVALHLDPINDPWRRAARDPNGAATDYGKYYPDGSRAYGEDFAEAFAAWANTTHLVDNQISHRNADGKQGVYIRGEGSSVSIPGWPDDARWEVLQSQLSSLNR